jgi:hypothetical protein
MELLNQRRILFASLLLATLLILFARPITNHFRSHRTAAVPEKAAPVTASPSKSPVKAAVQLTMGTQNKAVKQPTPGNIKATTALTARGSLLTNDHIKSDAIREFSGLPLQSILRTYHYTFEGQVSCPSAPCSPQVELVMETERNPDVRKKISVASDGTFREELTISELPLEQVDWRLIAHEARFISSETEGRQILNDESEISVVRQLALR